MVRTMAYCTAGVLRTKRTPARIAESRCSRGRPVKRRPRCQVNSADSTAMIDTAYSENARLEPPIRISMPASAGPIARVRLKPMPFSAIACTRSSRGTSSGTIALQAGPLIAAPMPIAKVSASSQKAVMAPVRVSMARAVAARIVQTCVPIRNTRRSTMSASAPPGRASRNTGMMVAACTMATMNGCGARLVISQPAPVFCSQVPSHATTLASHRLRKVELRSGSRAAGRRIRAS